MAKEWSKQFYNSKAWKRCRKSYIDGRIMIDGGMCEECHEELGFILHHKVSLTPKNIHNPEISLNHDNLQWVCKVCHDKFEGHGVGNPRAGLLVVFDGSGQPISLREVDSPPIKNSGVGNEKTDGKV